MEVMEQNQYLHMIRNIIEILESGETLPMLAMTFSFFHEAGMIKTLKVPKYNRQGSIFRDGLFSRRSLQMALKTFGEHLNPLLTIHSEDSKLESKYYDLMLEIAICANELSIELLLKSKKDEMGTLLILWENIIEGYNMGNKYSPKWSDSWIKIVDDLNGSLDRIVRSIFQIQRVYPDDHDVEEIIDTNGYVLPYSNRESLLEFYENVGFYLQDEFVFVVLKSSLKPTNSRLNLEMTPLVEISDDLIGIGHPRFDFQVTTLDEIVECWNHSLECDEDFFKSPIDGNPLSKSSVDSIVKIGTYKNHHPFIQIYRTMLEVVESSKVGDSKVRSSFKSLSDDQQKKVTRMLKDVFLVGMYMRRWDGKGPYPTKSDETETNDVEYYDVIEFSLGEGHGEEYDEGNDLVLAKVGKCIMDIREQFSNLDKKCKNLVRSLKTTEAYTKKTSNNPFWDGIAKETMEDRYCIRMASDSWIGTGARFFNVIRKTPKILDGFKMEEFVTIV
jgi:hypothetical protein